MKSMRKRFITTVWYFCLIGVITLGLVSIVGTGDSDDDGKSDTLPVYNFTIDMDPPVLNGMAEPQGTTTVPDKPGPLSIAIPYGVYNYILEVSGTIEGSINTEDDGYTIYNTTSVQIVDDAGDKFYLGDLSIMVTTDIEIPDEGFPTAGVWTVQSESMTQGGETITATIVVTPEPGVEIYNSVLGGEPVFYNWEDFEALTKDGEIWEQKAVYASELFKFMLNEQTPLITDTFGLIGDLGEGLEDGEPLTDWCSVFPEGQSPLDMPEQGYKYFTWFDVEDDDVVGPGDSFSWDFEYCWWYNQALFDGDIDLRGYTNVEDGGVTKRIGYEPSLDGPGGVYFDNFTIYQITYGGDRYETYNPMTLNGGFTIVFFEAD